MVVHVLNDLSFLENELTNADVDQVKVDAEKGVTEAEYILALLFDSGRGVKHNPREAEKWYKKAAEKGHPKAQYYLGKMYSTDTSGVKRDDAEANKWFGKAAEQGFQEAINKLAS